MYSLKGIGVVKSIISPFGHLINCLKSVECMLYFSLTYKAIKRGTKENIKSLEMVDSSVGSEGQTLAKVQKDSPTVQAMYSSS